MRKDYPMTTAIKRIRTLTLRGRRWRVRWLEKVFDHFGQREVWGLCDHAASTISLSLNQPPSEMADTLVHEVIHAILPKAKEKHVRNGATELLAALRHAGLCPKGGHRNEAGNSARTATAAQE